MTVAKAYGCGGPYGVEDKAGDLSELFLESVNLMLRTPKRLYTSFNITYGCERRELEVFKWVAGLFLDGNHDAA